MSYRLKLLLFGLTAAVVLLALNTGYQAVNTLQQVEVVEAQRDVWQRPADIIDALALTPGNTVVDLGCGSGYFTLKLSDAVDPGGMVYAIDIRRMPLAFLWARVVGKHRNVRIQRGQPDDPRVPSKVANAVLIANTYHEFENPGVILRHVLQSLVPGGRLVVVDPIETEHGRRSADVVEEELRRQGFDIVSNDDRFVDQPDKGIWWMIVARKPQAAPIE